MTQNLRLILNICIIMILCMKIDPTLAAPQQYWTNCVNGTPEEKCVHGGTCKRSNAIRQVYFVGGEMRTGRPMVRTYCKCSKEWAGKTCKEMNTCFNIRPCTRGRFINCQHISPDSFRCYCRNGWTGVRCESPQTSSFKLQRNLKDNPCRSNPCPSYRGRCHATYNTTGHYSGYSCKCVEEYTGVHCETARDCRHDGDKCKNNGSCRRASRRNVYVCTCMAPYTGFRCESLARHLHVRTGAGGAPANKRPRLDSSSSPCSSNPCQRGATCHNVSVTASVTTVATMPHGSSSSVPGFVCECPSDFIGDDCALPTEEELREFERMLHECQFGNWNVPSYLDILGFDELHYDILSNATFRRKRARARKKNPCKSGGFCIVRNNSQVYCHCPVGVSGELCSIPNAVTVSMQLQFQNHFDAALSDPASTAYRDLSLKMRVWISSTCMEDVGEPCRLADVKFSPGTITATYRILFHNQARLNSKDIPGKLSRGLRKNAKTFPDGKFKVIKESITVKKVKLTSDKERTENIPKPVIVSVVMASSSLIICTSVVFVCYRRKRRP